MKFPQRLVGFATKFVDKFTNSGVLQVPASNDDENIADRQSEPSKPVGQSPLEVSVVETVTASQCSARLKKALLQAEQEGRLPHLTLNDYVNDKIDGFEAYSNLPECGSRTLLELVSVLDEAIHRLQTEATQSKKARYRRNPEENGFPSWIEIAKLISDHKALSDQYVWLSAQHLKVPWPTKLLYLQLKDLRALKAPDLKRTLGPSLKDLDNPAELATLKKVLSFWNEPVDSQQYHELSPDACVSRMLESMLPQKSLQVLLKRIGSASQKRQTLTEIAASLRLSRERTRQIEANALVRMKEPIAQNHFKILLHSSRTDLESLLLGEDGCIRRSDLPKRLDNLGTKSLAVRCVHATLTKYADTNFVRLHGLYLRSDCDEQRLKRDFAMIENSIQNLSLPIALEVAASDLKVSVDSLICYAASTREQGTFEGYLYAGKLTSRKQRAIHLLQVLSGCLGGGPANFAEICAKFNFAVQTDGCSTREISRLLYEYSDQVLPLTDNGFATALRWCRLKERLIVQNSIVPALQVEEFRKFNPGTVHAALADLVDEMGPAPLLDIRGEFSKRYEKQWSANSVFAILTQTHYFVRMAPGVIGTLPMIVKPNKLKMCAALETELQVKIYIYAKKSQSWFNYPLWNADVEYQWCKSGDGRLPWETYNSLLAIANPDAWPIPQQQIDVWRARVEREGQFLLAIKPLPLYSKVPTVREICTLAMYIGDKPTISWLDINRVLGERIDSRSAMSFLAVLAKLGIIKLGRSWLLPIEVCPGAAYRFVNEIICNNKLNGTWHDVPELTDKIPDFKSLLINHRDFKRLLDAMQSVGKTAEGEPQQTSIFDTLDLT